MNSKFISHICTLLYLAMWHGWRSGYYVTFTMEFLIMKMEWEVSQRQRLYLCQGLHRVTKIIPDRAREKNFFLSSNPCRTLVDESVCQLFTYWLVGRLCPGKKKKRTCKLMVFLFLLHLFSQVQSMIGMLRDNHKSLDRLLDSFVFKWTFTIFMKVYTLVIFGYCLVPFIMLTYNRWFPILAQFYFFAHIIYLPWQLISPCIPMKKAKSHRNHQDNIQTKSESQDELN